MRFLLCRIVWLSEFVTLLEVSGKFLDSDYTSAINMLFVINISKSVNPPMYVPLLKLPVTIAISNM
jgi:hypothetical protein